MINWIKSLMGSIRTKEEVDSLAIEFQEIFFYLESAGDWAHLSSIIKELIDQNKKITILYSDVIPQLEKLKGPNCRIIFLPDNRSRSIIFKQLKVKQLVLTLPDLNNSHLKKSKHKVHYTYIFHSLVSTHMIYREGAFDHYDSILTCGPHHIQEIRKREKLCNLAPKNLLEHGYGRIDFLRSKESVINKNQILIAPSWGVNGLIESRLVFEIIDELLKNQKTIILRPHPMTLRIHPQLIDEIEHQYKNKIKIVNDMSENESILSSQTIVSDWSGVALEYSFSLYRPVIFIDTPKKVNNPNWKDLEIEPLEVSIREKIGKVLNPDQLDKLCSTIDALEENIDLFQEEIKKQSDLFIFNSGKSSKVAADHIIQINSEID